MDADALRLLAIDTSVSWLSERVLAQWPHPHPHPHPHPQHLGTLSTHNRSPTLAFAIGRSDSHIVIALHLAVKLRASSATSKPKHLFMIVPIRSLAFAPPCNIYRAANLPEPTHDAVVEAGLAATGSAGAQRLIHLHFRLTAPAYVVMPQVTIPSSPQGTPLRLLRALRSLSQAPSFDIYLRFNTYAQVELQRVCQILREGRAIPVSIDPVRSFKGTGAADIWDQYLIDPDSGPSSPEPCPEHQTDHSPPQYTDTATVLVPRIESGEQDDGGYVSRLSSMSRVAETPPAPPLRKRKATSPPARPLSPAQVAIDAETSETAGAGILLAELAQWLDWAWSFDRTMHERFCRPLLALGAAAWRGDAAAFADVRAQCTSRLLFAAVSPDMDPASLQRDLHLRSLAALPRDFRAETARLVRWITGLYSAADIVFERELLRLVHAAQRAEAGAAGPAAVEAFEREKARCAARVCYILGHCGVVPLCVAGEPATQA